ncbi:MAG: alpha/beta hydrolase [Brevefilum sp.]|nr:alpha/beta hydrolase [Brevefilum sp.]
MKYVPFSFSSKDGLTLQGRVWLSHHNRPKGIIYLLHDLGEHSAHFSHVAEAFSENHYHFVALDLRGHGLSEGKRGHSPSDVHLMNDIQNFIRVSNEKLRITKLPSILYGHGLGANLAINYMLIRQPNITGVIATSPMFMPPFKVNKSKAAALKILANISPRLKLNNHMKAENLSWDLAVVQAYEEDVYNHNHLTARLALDIFQSGNYALANANKWYLPMLIMHGTADLICPPAASQEFAEKARTLVDLVLLNQFYHEIHNDFEKELVIKKMLDWVEKEIQ